MGKLIACLGLGNNDVGKKLSVVPSDETIPGSKECFRTVKAPLSHKHTWIIQGLSSLQIDMLYSKVFTTGDYQWRIQLYPKGRFPGTNSLSMYLVLADLTNFPPGREVYAIVNLILKNQNRGKDKIFTMRRHFGLKHVGFGLSKFLSLNDINEPSKGFTENDNCVIQAYVTILGISDS